MRNQTGNGYSGFLAILGLLTLLTGAVILMLLPAMRVAAWGILVLGAALIITAFVLSLRRVGHALVSRQGRMGTGSMVMASTFLGIIVLLNAISFQGYHRFDITGAAQFTLTSQTKDILKGLTAPVKAIAFFTPSDPVGIASYATSLMTEYQNYTDKITFKVIDPDEHPDQARQYGITEYQTVAFERGEHRRLVSPMDIATEAEHAFTSAILEVTGTVQKKIYFLTGHDEANIFSTASDGYSKARNGLRDNLYQVDTLDLLLTPAIPKDCAALVIAGPRQAFSDSETELIHRYLANGGAAMFLLNPGAPTGVGSLLANWGVDIADGTVIDPTSYAAPSVDSPSVPRIRDFFGFTVTYFPGALALVPQEKAQDALSLSALLWTSKDSWLEKEFTPGGNAPVFDEGKDVKGPVALAVLITPAPPPTPTDTSTPVLMPPDTRIIVIGDSDFASDQHFYNGDNGQLFVTAVNLLAEGKEVISIDRKVMPFRRLVTGPETTSFIQYSSIGLVPVLVLLAGGIVWWRRK